MPHTVQEHVVIFAEFKSLILRKVKWFDRSVIG